MSQADGMSDWDLQAEDLELGGLVDEDVVQSIYDGDLDDGEVELSPEDWE